jgi:hypothetical protein
VAIQCRHSHSLACWREQPVRCAPPLPPCEAAKILRHRTRLFRIVHLIILLHPVGNKLDHVACGVVHISTALSIMPLLSRASVAVGDVKFV